MATTAERKLRDKRIRIMKYIAIVIVVLILLVALSSPFISGEEVVKTDTKAGLKQESQNTPVNGKEIDESWKKQADRRNDHQDKEVNKLINDNEDLRNQLKTAQEALKANDEKMTSFERDVAAAKDLINVVKDLKGSLDNTSTNQKKSTVPEFKKPDVPQYMQNQQQHNGTVQFDNNGNYSRTSSTDKVIESQPVQQQKHFNTVYITTFEQKQGSKKNDNKLIIPMGFAVGVTLTGGDMPTLNWGQQDPQPIAISVESTMITAGGEEVDIKDCLLMAAMHGEVSSERGIGIMSKMECRDKKKNLYVGKVEGFVVGDEGKIGMKGRLVTREGTVVAQTIFASMIGALGTSIKSGATDTAETTYGLVNTINSSKTAEYTVGSGIESGTSEIKKYYLKFLDQIYPVVEILPGRRVTVMFSGGSVLEKITGLEKRTNYVDYQNEGQIEAKPAQVKGK